MSKYIFALFIFITPLFGEIIEVDKFEKVLEYAEPGVVFIVDIDDTLITPVQQLGTNRWFCRRMDHYLSLGYGLTESLGRALPEWEAVQQITDSEVVEEDTPSIIHNLQDRGFYVLALTTRGLGLSTRTIHQLQDFSLDFNRSVPHKAEVLIFNPRDVLFRKGVLFTSGTHKGRALFKLFEEWKYQPKKIVFVNDKASQLRQVEECCIEEKIPFVGLRYSRLDERKANFDPQIADLQFEEFCNLLSDRQARRIISQR